MSDTSVALDTGASVPHDYLVLAPGSSYPEPALKGFTGSLAERSATMQVLHPLSASLRLHACRHDFTKVRMRGATVG